MSPLEKNKQRASELLASFSQPRGLDLHVIPQQQLLGVGMEANLLVNLTLRWTQAPLQQRAEVVAIPSYHKQQNQPTDPPTWTARIRINRRH